MGCPVNPRRSALTWVPASVLALALGPAAVPAETSPDAAAGPGPHDSWLQFGGPGRDFQAMAGPLATQWPEGGPETLWERPLGEGYSAVLFENGRLYTMYRVEQQEAVICLDAATGATIWEFRYDAAAVDQQTYGRGPRSTPLIAGDRIFSIGIGGELHALDKGDGTLRWSRKLWGPHFGGNRRRHGYSSSPIAFQETVIATVGGEGASLVAFDQADGAVRWKELDFRNSHSSPQIVEIAGETQLVTFMAEELIGVDPASGTLRWRYPHVNQWGHNITMPVFLDGETIFLSSAQVGARGLKLARREKRIDVEQVWSNRRIQFYHGSAVRHGDWVYGSSGVVSSSFLSAVNIRTGEIGWRERGFSRANLVRADGKLIILDEDGVLAIATADPEGLTVHSRHQLLGQVSWTAPTIVGTTMYARDQRTLVAVDLGVRRHSNQPD